MATAPEQIAAAYPWLPAEVVVLYTEAYNEGVVNPWTTVRADARYETWFPGNLTEDGTVRYGETQYATARESYNDVLRSVGIENTDLFADEITMMIRGERRPDEFAQGVHDLYDRILSASDEIREFYADANGITDLTTAGMIAGYLNPEIGDKILQGRLTMAEIGGEADVRGYDISFGYAELLAQNDLTRGSAQDLFGKARQLLPTLDILAKRQEDPDDTFDLEEFVSSEFFNDPRENLRMRRLLSRERSSFTASTSFAKGRTGGLVGLEFR